MNNPSFDELNEVYNSRYALVMMTAERARKIVDGSEPLIETKDKNPITISLEEIMDGKIDIVKEY